VEEAWELYMQAERKDLRNRRSGLLARLLGSPLPDESLDDVARLAEEDRLRAEAGLVELRDPHGEGVTYKPLEDLTREDRHARVAAEGARASWLKERHEKRASALARLGSQRLRLEEERSRLLAAELLEGARAQERRSIGRELHDRVAHTMGLAHQSLQLYEALQASDPDRAQAKLALAKRMIVEAMGQTRDLSTTLREAEAEGGLEPALSELLEEALSPETSYELEVQGDEGLLSVTTRDQMFLILREAVRNAMAHLGMGLVRIMLKITEGEAIGIVEDDGGGFDPDEAKRNGSGGLRYMEERATLMGGRLRVESAPDRSTRVAVEVPLPPRGAPWAAGLGKDSDQPAARSTEYPD
jgi:signal transduction histidine kinase